ncbi:MAG: hypothetical protein CME66_06035 [Halobacteriovoraceae bacterium]|nr:hypothetical protein [Halobacteriovoraceae bacterium]
MHSVFISDIHIKSSRGKGTEVFLSFCRNPNVKKARNVYFLGDIFDLLIGEHKNYIRDYAFFFNEIINFLAEGKTVTFIEGNHDFHFEKTIKRYIRKKSKNWQNFFYYKNSIEIKSGHKKILICHGYEVDYDNKYFKRWYKIYSSKFMYILSSYILPYFIIKKLGDWASSNSKKRGQKVFNYDEMKQKYIRGANDLLEEKMVDIVVAGHTHIPAHKKYSNGKLYVNNGFPKRDLLYIAFDGEEFSLNSLN